MTCGLTRVLVIAAGSGMFVASLTHADPVGWAAAIVAAAAMLAFERRAVERGTASCSVPATPRQEVDR